MTNDRQYFAYVTAAPKSRRDRLVSNKTYNAGLNDKCTACRFIARHNLVSIVTCTKYVLRSADQKTVCCPGYIWWMYRIWIVRRSHFEFSIFEFEVSKRQIIKLLVVLFFQSLFVGFLIVCSNDHVFNPFSSFNFYLLNNRFLIIYIVKMSHYFITRQFKSVTQENCWCIYANP